jgi:hypothetical protein
MTYYGFGLAYLHLGRINGHKLCCLQVIAVKHVTTHTWPIMAYYGQKLKFVRRPAYGQPRRNDE